MTKAVILAAGEGSRLRPLTKTRPKCLVELNGESLLSRQIRVLNSALITDIHLVTGYLEKKFSGLGMETSHNVDFENTNMVHSLFCAMKFLKSCSEDLIIAYGDIVYEKRNLEAMMLSADDVSCMIDESWLQLWKLRNEDPLDDAETLVIGERNTIVEIGKKPENYEKIDGQYTGLLKIKAAALPSVIDFYLGLDRNRLYDGKDFENMYMTSFLQELINSGMGVHAVPVNGGWLEVDSVSDIELYERLEQNGELAALCAL